DALRRGGRGAAGALREHGRAPSRARPPPEPGASPRVAVLPRGALRVLLRLLVRLPPGAVRPDPRRARRPGLDRLGARRPPGPRGAGSGAGLPRRPRPPPDLRGSPALAAGAGSGEATAVRLPVTPIARPRRADRRVEPSRLAHLGRPRNRAGLALGRS